MAPGELIGQAVAVDEYPLPLSSGLVPARTEYRDTPMVFTYVSSARIIACLWKLSNFRSRHAPASAGTFYDVPRGSNLPRHHFYHEWWKQSAKYL